MSSKIVARVFAAVVLVGAALVLVIVFMQPSDDAKQADENTTPTPATGSASTGNVAIVFTDSGFTPNTYTVSKGETVTVTNKSSSNLEFSSDDHPTHTEETELNMATLAPGESGTFTPTKVGTWTFHDHLHSQFTGTLKVTE